MSWLSRALGRDKANQEAAAAAAAANRLPVEAPNTLFSKAIADVLCVIGEGPIPEPDDLQESIYLNGVPVKSADGTINFSDFSADLLQGYPDQAYVPGNAAAETINTIGTEVTYATPVVQAVTDLTATGVRVSISIPTLVSVDSKTGDRSPTAVSIKIEVQPNGGSYTTAVTDTISGKCISQYLADYEFELIGSGPWNVRVSRLTADSTSDTLINETHWATMSVLRDYRLAYPDVALLRLRFSAEQMSGQFPQIEYEGDGLILEIPSNYDPEDRTYDGVWDGTFTTGWTDNPAWVIWAVMTNDRWGLGRWIDSGSVDKWLLYSAAVWFDESVSDGAEGVQPRYRFNGTVESVIKAYEAISMMAGACQGMTYWASGAASLVVDKPDDPIKLIGPSNVVEGKFTYEGSDLATRPTSVHTTWFDPSNGYQKAIEVVEDAELIARHGLRIKEVAALFCTSQGQAKRVGRYELETAWSETQTVAFAVGQDAHDLSPGDLVDIADPIIQGRRMSGRVLAISGTTVTLDDDVLIESGITYDLSVIDDTGAIQTRNVVMAPGSYDEVTIASVFSPEPVVGAVWMFVGSNLGARRFRVITIDENTDDGTYAVSAVLHDPNKQARIEDGVTVDLPAISAYKTGPIDAPSDLVIDEAIERLPAGSYRHRTTLAWGKHPDPRVTRYEVEYMDAGGIFWTAAGYAPGTTAEIDNLGSGTYQFRVRAVAFDGALSPWASPISEALTGLDAAPPDVDDLTIAVVDASALLAWSTVTVANLDHYEVRFAEDAGANWQSMVPIAPRVSGTSVQTAARTGIYAVKAVTAQGVESDAAAFVLCDVTGLTINVVETSAAHPTWSGTFSQCEFEDDRDACKLSIESGYEVYEDGTYTWPTYIDLGEIFTSRVSAALVAFGEETTDDIWDEPNIWLLPTIWGSQPTGWDAYIEVQVTEDDPGITSPPPMWSDWTKLVVSDLRFRAIWPRLILKRGIETITPIVTEATIIIDMPDRIDAQGGIAVDSGGTRVSFTAAFRGPARPSVVITGIEGAAAGDWADVTNVDETGFDVTIKDSGGTGLSGRSIDYHAKGYGKVLT